MFSLADLFHFPRLFSLKDGEIDLMGLPVGMVPVSILCEIQKALVKEVGFRRAYQMIYDGAKTGSYEYNQRFIKEHALKDVTALLDLQGRIVTLAGWGKFQFAKIDVPNREIVKYVTDAPFPKAYGKSAYSACIIQSGFISGGVTASVKFPAETFETKCMARGDPQCTFFISTKERVDQVREEHWSKWEV